jgi:osmotically-inducible protein OsmY
VGVTNHIAVKPHASSPDVRDKILAALKRKAELQTDSVHISVKGDKVILEGSVKTWSERNLVESAAWSAAGVGSVEDNLRFA